MKTKLTVVLVILLVVSNMYFMNEARAEKNLKC